jgi:hypothetical protein
MEQTASEAEAEVVNEMVHLHKVAMAETVLSLLDIL